MDHEPVGSVDALLEASDSDSSIQPIRKTCETEWNAVLAGLNKACGPITPRGGPSIQTSDN